jgi:hypothetical protein
VKEQVPGMSRRRSEEERETVDQDRRAVISMSAVLAAFSGFSGGWWLIAQADAAAAPGSVEDFRALSVLLTGAPDLDPALAERAYNQLTALDADFPSKATAVAKAVGASAQTSVDAFLASPQAGGDGLKDTMITIVSAWYLGYTGTPISLRAEDNTGFVTFTKALMYAPTVDATVYPTYARDGINYWVDPPPFVTPPPTPPGIKSWGRDSPQGKGPIPDALAPSPGGTTPPDPSATGP